MVVTSAGLQYLLTIVTTFDTYHVLRTALNCFYMLIQLVLNVLAINIYPHFRVDDMMHREIT